MVVDGNVISYEWKLPIDIAGSILPKVGFRDIQKKPFDFRELTKAVISNETSGESKDIMENLPPGYRVYFPVVPKIVGGAVGRHSLMGSAIRINQGVDSPYGFLVLAHEIGHAVESVEDYPTRSHRTLGGIALKGLLERRFGAKNQAMELQRERDAWAVALNDMRPFLSDDPEATFSREKVRDVIEAALWDVSEDIRKEQAGSA